MFAKRKKKSIDELLADGTLRRLTYEEAALYCESDHNLIETQGLTVKSLLSLARKNYLEIFWDNEKNQVVWGNPKCPKCGNLTTELGIYCQSCGKKLFPDI